MKARIVTAFDGAHGYDAHAGVQRQVATELGGYIRALPLPQRPQVLEIGCGTGFLTQALADAFPGADWLMTDIAPAMVERSRERFRTDPRFRFAVLDGEHPDLDEPPFDHHCTSLAVQWFEELRPGLERLLSLLRPGGHLAFSTLVEDSFTEWRQAHDELGLEHGMQSYPSVDELVGLKLGGREGDIRFDWFAEPYPSGPEFVRGLREIGAGTPRPGHRPLGPAAFRQVLRRFEAGGAIARYHVAFCRFTA
jgi:malonyl-CoA O-methyltransferase